MKKSKSNMEIRTLPLEELRINNLEEKRYIEGHAAVFDSWSETLGGIFPFKEKVRKGAFSQTIEKDDIRALFNHDPNYVLGRNKAGTLELKEDETGLYVRIIPPDTQAARDLITSIERGDINQMSFGFTVEEEKWDTVEGIDVRELRKVKLFDVSPVTFPAYPSTDVGVRAMESYENYRAEVRNKEEMKSRAAEKAAAKRKIESLKTKWRYL
jgi:HK97 family phage prohead protease